MATWRPPNAGQLGSAALWGSQLDCTQEAAHVPKNFGAFRPEAAGRGGLMAGPGRCLLTWRHLLVQGGDLILRRSDGTVLGWWGLGGWAGGVWHHGVVVRGGAGQ